MSKGGVIEVAVNILLSNPNDNVALGDEFVDEIYKEIKNSYPKALLVGCPAGNFICFNSVQLRKLSCVLNQRIMQLEIELDSYRLALSSIR